MDKFTYQCMIRQLLRYKADGNKEAVNGFLNKRKTGIERNEIIEDCKTQWKLGNRGEWGKWL